jgi:cobalt/nickel transport system permease protein/cobalt/nickel transport protein
MIAAAMLVAALLLAGVLSFYASGDPDGLNRVAEDNGFSSAQADSPAAGSPLAGYETSGIGEDRLSGGLAGVAGVLVVLVLAGGVAHVVRRRGEPVDADRR